MKLLELDELIDYPIRLAGKVTEIAACPDADPDIVLGPAAQAQRDLIFREAGVTAEKAQQAMARMRAGHLEAGDWFGYISTHPRPLRIKAFTRIMPQLRDDEYWSLLRHIWTDAELPNANRLVWLSLFKANRGERQHLMSPQEHVAFAALPERVRIYRGASAEWARGMSWTTDEEKARWFAQWRVNRERNPQVFTTTLHKTVLLAHFLERRESEAVIDPRRIRYEMLALVS